MVGVDDSVASPALGTKVHKNTGFLGRVQKYGNDSVGWGDQARQRTCLAVQQDFDLTDHQVINVKKTIMSDLI